MDASGLTICTVNKKLPLFQPNIYMCPLESSCCIDGRQPKCCANEVGLKESVDSMLFMLPMFFAFLALAFFIYCYFGDSDPVDLKTCKANFESVKRLASGEKIYDEMVRDPVFGQLYHAEVAKKAYLEKERKSE